MSSSRIMDGRDIYRMDMGLYIGIIFRPLIQCLYKIHVLWPTSAIDHSSYTPYMTKYQPQTPLKEP